MIYNRPRRQKKVKITLAGSVFDEYCAYVKVGSKKYKKAVTIEADPGTQFTVYAGAGSKSAYTRSGIYINNSATANYGIGESGNAYYKYITLTANEDATIKFTKHYKSGNPYYTAYVTMPA